MSSQLSSNPLFVSLTAASQNAMDGVRTVVREDKAIPLKSPPKARSQGDGGTSASSTSKTISSWLGRTWAQVSSVATMDNIAKVSIAASVALGCFLVADASTALQVGEGIALAASGTSLVSLVWAMGSAFKGERAKAAQLLLLSGATGAIFASQYKAFRLQGERDRSLRNSKEPQDSLEDRFKRYRLGFEDKESACALQLGEFRKKAELYETLQKTHDQLEQEKLTLQTAHDGLKKDCGAVSNREQVLQSKYEALRSRGILSRIWNADPESVDSFKKVETTRHVAFGSTYVGGNPKRDALSKLVDKTHEEYAARWDLEYRLVTENRLKGECNQPLTYINLVTKTDCVPYWNKIAVLRDWLKEENIGREDWYVLADDDMPVTNMKIDPYKVIDTLRRGKDTSVIVARDVSVWNGDERSSVNTGLLIVRRDEQSRQLIEKIWEKRNSVGTGDSHCRTLGTCTNQDTLHEQQAMAEVIKESYRLLDKVVTVVLPRDKYDGEEIALNTFERSGCFVRKQEGWGSSEFSYEGSDRSYREGAWRVGDWMGQTAGVPVEGWYCSDKRNGLPPGPIRRDKLEKMISKTVR